MPRKNLNNSIKQSFFWAITCISSALFLFCIYSLYNHFNEIKELEDKYFEIENITLNSLVRRKEKIDFFKKHKNSKSNYLLDFLNTKSLLANEKENLNYLKSHPCFCKNPIFEEKINMINNNKFELLIGEQYEKKNIKETIIALKYPIYCSYKDLTEILSKIDGIRTSKLHENEIQPQIIPHYINIEFNDFDCLFDCKVMQREFN